MPLTVLVFLLLDIVTTMIGQAYGVSDLGRTGWLASAQRFLLAAAAAATMWNRPRTAVALTAIVITLVFTAGPTGEELWLLLIAGVTAAVRARRRQLGLIVLAQIAYAGCFGWRVEQTFPGEGWTALAIMLGTTALGIVVGLVARRLFQARDRRRLWVQQLEREQTKIRAIERTRLADELQVVTTQGLAAIEEDLNAVSRRTPDLDNLRSGLTRIDVHSRSLLMELRTLLHVLRRDRALQPDVWSAVSGSGHRSWVDLLTARHVRMAATAVFGLLAARAAVGGLGSLPASENWVQMIGLLACAVAVWRPVVGASCAAVAVFVSLALGSATYWDALAVAQLCLMGALYLGTRRIWLVVLALAGYGGLLAITDSDDYRSHIVLVSYIASLGIAVGVAARYFVAAREASVHQLMDLANERDRMEAEERSSVARELHDVVAHSLSVTTMLVMATSLSDDCGRLADTIDQVRRSTEAAHHELSTLLYALRGPDTDHLRPSPLVTPLASAGALVERLFDNGYQAVLDVDPAANALDPTTQRTLSRIMQEGATNILRYTPAGATCHYTLAIDATGVRLTIVSPMAVSERKHYLSLGWGLRGIRERVDLTHGTFTAGPNRGRWVLEITLPATTHPANPVSTPLETVEDSGSRLLPGTG